MRKDWQEQTAAANYQVEESNLRRSNKEKKKTQGKIVNYFLTISSTNVAGFTYTRALRAMIYWWSQYIVLPYL